MEFSSRLLSSLLLLTLTFSAQAFVPEASELQQQKFKHGWIAPYKQEYASQYLQDISYGFNNNRYGIFDDIPFNSEYDLLKEDVAFWAMILAQLADIHSTYKGVKYDCITEFNPLLPARPEVHEMLMLKTAVIWPSRKFLYTEEEKIWYDSINALITAYAAYRNYKITDDASNASYCRKNK